MAGDFVSLVVSTVLDLQPERNRKAMIVKSRASNVGVYGALGLGVFVKCAA
jgi:hypothetical protein